MIFATTGLPNRGDPENRMHHEKSMTGSKVAGNYYIKHAYKDAKSPNFVTVVLGDYRSLDTLGELVVVFTAGLICILILRGKQSREDVV